MILFYFDTNKKKLYIVIKIFSEYVLQLMKKLYFVMRNCVVMKDCVDYASCIEMSSFIISRTYDSLREFQSNK